MKKLILFLLIPFCGKGQTSSELIKKFEDVKNMAEVLSVKNDTVNMAVKFCEATTGTYTGNNLMTLDTRHRLSSIMVVFLSKRDFDYYVRKHVDDRFILMKYHMDEVEIEGRKIHIIFTSEDLFMKGKTEFSALCLMHELLHYIQNKVRHNLILTREDEVEAYTLMINLFTDNLNAFKKKRWDYLVGEVSKLHNPADAAKDKRFIDICSNEFGDSMLVNLLIIQAMKPTIFVYKYYID